MLIKPDEYGLHPVVHWSTVKQFKCDREAIERLVKLECAKHLDTPVDSLESVELIWDSGTIYLNITTDTHEKEIKKGDNVNGV